MSVKDLVIGAECGGSDYTSGLAGNVVVGRFYDWLTDQGGTAIFEEIVEAIGLDHLLLKRAASEQAAKELRYTYDKALGILPQRASVFGQPRQLCRRPVHH